ncbi:GPO family capsid scaffolding protein [Yersinia enterocolitica]|uniref:GPO family capsid scaffolding protein n=1 Tax=Yersinia enterocolitica TaxID=630 RepID=UPI0033010D57|nr:GPO family capsid scaffolding protein [Yersinia enterocolitica]
MPQLKTDWVVIATSGPTIDGREVKPEWLTDAAETYNRSEYTAMIWPYHSSPEWRAFSANLGEVDELKVEKAGDKIQLMARLIPNRFLTEANKAGQKLFTSIEVGENYLGTGKFFLKGVAVTDTPASISTTRLQFSQGVPSKKLHPTAKPEELMAELVKTANTNGVILDPFMGSGTTGVAALKTGCQFIGIESSEHYFEVASQRLHAAITK